MRDINRVQLLGRLGNDPVRRGTAPDHPVATFSLATSRRWKGDDGALQEDTEWHSIVTFGALAETVHAQLGKGHTVLVDGRLRSRVWTGDDGAEHRLVEIVARDVNFIARPQGAGQ